MTEPRPRIAVVVLPGSNDDRDAAWALGALGAEPVLVWHASDRLPEDVGAVVLPGVLRPNASLSFVCRDVALRVERVAAPFTSRCEPGGRLVIPVKHGEGCWFYPLHLLPELERDDQVVLRYADEDNPNGSVANVAGVCNREGNVMGLMPHPEHAVDPLLGSGDGAMILASLVDAARDRVAAIA